MAIDVKANSVDETAKKEEQKFERLETNTHNDMVIEVNGKEKAVYRFVIPFNAPLAEAHMACVNVMLKIREIYDDIIAKQKEAEAKKEADNQSDNEKK